MSKTPQASQKQKKQASPQTASPVQADIQTAAPELTTGGLNAQRVLQLQRQVGNRAVAQMLKGQGLPPISRQAEPRIQRNIMPLDTFIKESTIKKWRSAEIKEVDKALEEYHAMSPASKDKPYAFFKLKRAIQKYKTAHTDEKTGEATSGRMGAIKTLERQIEVMLKDNRPQVRLWSASEFEQKTEQKRTGGKALKSSLQNDIIGFLHKFWALPDPMGADIETAIPLLYEMKEYANLWLEQYGERGKSNRQDRAIGLINFVSLVDDAIKTVAGELDVSKRAQEIAMQSRGVTMGRARNIAPTAQQTEQARQERIQQIRESYKGNAHSMFATVTGFLVGAMASKPGDRFELDLEVQIPVEPTGVGFLGGHLVVKAESEGQKGKQEGTRLNTTKVRAELSLTGGLKAEKLAMFRAELGGYFEAQGRTPTETMKLVSYAFYRRLRESSWIPHEVANIIWGGRSTKAGYILAEKWASAVEKQVFSGEGDDKTYAESGGFGAATGEIGDDKIAKGSLSSKLSVGTRYDKATVEKKKREKYGKKLGESLDYQKRGRMRRLGEDSIKTELKIAASALGMLEGDFKLSYGGRTDNPELELEGNGLVKIPLGTGLAFAINNVTKYMLTRIVDILRALGGVGPEVKVEAGDVIQGLLSGKQFYDVLKSGLEIGKESTMNVLGATMKMLSESGINLLVKAKYNVNKKEWEIKISIEMADNTKVDISVLKAKLKVRKRIVGFLIKKPIGADASFQVI